MAQPISLEIPPHDGSVELENRLKRAQVQHGEALLAGIQVLQALHDRGVLDTLVGALGSADKVLPMVVDAAKTPEGIRAARNLLVLGKFVCSLEPELLESITLSVATALNSASAKQPPSLWQLAKRMAARDTRRALTVTISMVEAFGKSLDRRERNIQAPRG